MLFRDAICILLLLFSPSCRAHFQECFLSPRSVTVEDDADAVIGALLPLHHPGDGVLGCGKPNPDAVEVYEAMRWAIHVLNRKSGLISDSGVTGDGSLIPGVKIGLKVYDNCGHDALALEHLTDLFPALRTGTQTCGNSTRNSALNIGVVDMSGISQQPKVSDTLREFYIPSIQLSLSSVIPPERMAQVLVSSIRDLLWSSVTVLHEEEEYSISVAKQFVQAASSESSVCIGSVRTLPSRISRSNRQDVKQFRKIFRAATLGLSQGSAVIVITKNEETAATFLQVMTEFPEIFERLQWLFSWIPPQAALSSASRHLPSTSRMYSIAPYPDRVRQFEEYWSLLKDTADFSNNQDRWFLEYLMDQKKCKVNDNVISTYRNFATCADRNITDAPVARFLRTSRVVPALTGVFTLVAALHRAWETQCRSDGLCTPLIALPRKEFVGNFLEPVEYLVEKQQSRRSPRDTSGGLEASKLSLAQYWSKNGREVDFKQVVVYEQQEAIILDDTFVSLPSRCSASGCKGCVRPRQSRLEDRLQDLDIAESSAFSSRQDTFEDEGTITLPLLLPLHEAGLSPYECGPSLNVEAVQNLEAAFWTVDRINEDATSLAGARLTLKVIDTCSSSLLTTQKLATYIAESHLDTSAGFAVVSAASPEETLAANSVLSSLNVSTVSSSDVTSHVTSDVGLGSHLFQVSASHESRVQAAVTLFEDMGWKFISLVYEDTTSSQNIHKTLIKATQQRGICIAHNFAFTNQDISETDMNKLIQNLIEAKNEGASVVVLLTGEEATRQILATVGRFLEATALQLGDLAFVGLGEWGDKMDLFRGSKKEALGSLIFKPETGEVSEFSTYYRHLVPGSNPRNPWLDELWYQEQSSVNTSSGDSTVRYVRQQSTANTIQAIVAVAAGIASLRNQLCPIEEGVCPSMQQRSDLPEILSGHIFSSSSPRLDNPGQTFRLEKDGSGNIPIELYNYRMVYGGRMDYLKVGSFNGHYTKIANLVTYTPVGELPIESVRSVCIIGCYKCSSPSQTHLVIPSPQNLYIGAALEIHGPDSNPLSCGPIKNFQGVEAALWTLDIINSDPNLLPGLDLGLMFFDTCGSKEKVAMDISNFLTSRVNKDLPSPDTVIGFLAEGTSTVIGPLVDLTMSLGMTTIATSVVDLGLESPKKYPQLLKMSMPSDVIITSIVDILRFFHWKYVSVVYDRTSSESLFGQNAFSTLKAQMDAHSIEIAVTERLQPGEDITSAMNVIAHRLKIKQNAGARVIVLLLPAPHIERLLDAFWRLQQEGRSRAGDFVFIAVDALEPFRLFPDQSSGSLVLKSHNVPLAAFKEHCAAIRLQNGTMNPWVREYWEQIFDCRGKSCLKGSHQSLTEVGFTQDKSVPNIVNALFSLALGLDSLQRQLCPERNTWCPAAKNAYIRQRLFESVKKIRFTGLDGSRIIFGEHNYVNGILDVYHFRDVGDVRAFLNIGVYDEKLGLSINSSMTKGYNENGELVSLENVPSFCNDSDSCLKKHQVTALSLPFMKIPAEEEFVIGIMMPVHQPGFNYFTCSRIIEDNSFQNLLALSFALDRVNENDTILPQIKLGALVFDHCGRRQKAEEQIFSFIASDGALPFKEAKIKSRAMFAALTYDPLVADDLSPLFESALIPQVSTSSSLLTTKDSKSRSSEESQEHVVVKVLVEVLQRFNWQFVTLLHTGSESDRSTFWSFIEASKSKKICISESLVIRSEMSVSELTMLFAEELGVGHEARVIVMLLDDSDLQKNVLQAAKEASVIENFLWISVESDKDDSHLAKVLQGVDVDFFLLKLETYEVSGFRDYYTRFNLMHHDPIPDLWFEEFWQRHFQCHLPQSVSPLKDNFPSSCKGTESLSAQPLQQDNLVYQTVWAVESMAEALHDFLRRYCAHGDAATSLEDCGTDARHVLWREMRKRFAKNPPTACVDGDCGPLKISIGYQVFQLKKIKIYHAYHEVGFWKDGTLSLNIEDAAFVGGTKIESTCHQQCQKCLDQLSVDPEELNILRPSIYANFRTMWGGIVSALSLLGALLVLICAAYFLVSFPVTIGTTVLGYMILFGLFLLYMVNLAFVLSPSEGTCGVRRFGLGLAYATVFAGMLVKVMNIWRMLGYKGNQYFGEIHHITNPAALLVVAVGLVIIQVILSAAWLILIPPKTGLHMGEWRCHPATTFEDELVISLVYVMLVLAITILFSALTWSSQDNNRESRWILTCCSCIALIWIAWTILSTQVLHKYRDLAISIANLACASVVMLCMYLRKVYIYNKLTKHEEKKAKIQQSLPLPPVPNMYGTLTRPTLNLGCNPAFNNGPRVAPSRMALISAEDNSSDNGSGSTQVQATDLYPLDMYDGGSQFQPVSLPTQAVT